MVTTVAAPTAGMTLAVTKDVVSKDVANTPGATVTALLSFGFEATLKPSNTTTKGEVPFMVK
jgi:hypothetical protein